MTDAEADLLTTLIDDVLPSVDARRAFWRHLNTVCTTHVFAVWTETQEPAFSVCAHMMKDDHAR